MADVNVNLTPGPAGELPPVVTESQGASSTSGTSGVVASPEAVAAAQAGVQAAQGVTAAQQAINPALAAKTEGVAAGLEQQAASDEAAAAEAQRVRERYAERIKIAQGEMDKAVQRYETFQFHNFWRDGRGGEDTGRLITASLAGFFGGFAAGMNGGPNYAIEAINRAMDRDFEAQRAQLTTRENIAKWRRDGVEDIYGHMQKELAALDVKQSLAHRAVAAKAQALAIRSGLPLEQAQNNVVVAQQNEKSADKDTAAKQRYEQHAERQQTRSQQQQVTSAKPTGGGGVEADKNAANFSVLKEHGTRLAEQMPKLSPEDVRDINRVLGTEEFLGKGNVSGALAALGLDAETGVSPAAKAYLDSARRAAEALGRVQSGAAIGTEEGRRFMQSLVPKPSDVETPGARELKAKNILSDIQNRGAFLERKPRGAASATQPNPAAAARADAIRWLEQNPNAPAALREKVRRGIARLNVQLGER